MVLADESCHRPDRVVNAAVLAALFEEDGEARLVLTRRSTKLRSHRGEVSFPGGRIDPGEDPPAAALREAFEEVALDPAPSRPKAGSTLSSPWCRLAHHADRGGTPSRPHVVASPAEVERVFDVSLADLGPTGELPRGAMAVPRIGPSQNEGDDGLTVWFFEVEGELIWGATARMIHELLLSSCSHRE